MGEGATLVNLTQRMGTLQLVSERVERMGWARECFGRGYEYMVLGCIVQPMLSSQSAAWSGYISDWTCTDWLEVLAPEEGIDRFPLGGLARSALALGVVVGGLAKPGTLAVELEAIRLPKEDGVARAVMARLKGKPDAPSDGALTAFGDWIDKHSNGGLVGMTVELSEQSIDEACQWVKAFQTADPHDVVDGTVWRTLSADRAADGLG